MATDQVSIMSQLQGEMDELHHLQYSTDFSTDVNRKMQVPTRLSMEPDDAYKVNPPSPTGPAPKLNFDMNGLEGSPAHAMNVPDRILIAGSDEHIGARQTPKNLDLDNMAPFPQPGENVGLTTPPRTLTLDQITFPAVGDKSAMKPKESAIRHSGDANSSMVAAPNSDGPMSPDLLQLQKRVLLLSSKVSSLEQDSLRRDRREQIVLGIGVLYLVFKGLRFLFRSPYP